MDTFPVQCVGGATDIDIYTNTQLNDIRYQCPALITIFISEYIKLICRICIYRLEIQLNDNLN